MFEPTALNFAAVPRPAFGRAAQHLPATTAKTKADQRHMRQARDAATVLPNLPAVGESFHVILPGTVDLCSIVIAQLRKVRCRHLRLTTLAMSKRNMADLIGVLEADRTMKFTLIVSEYYKSHNKDQWAEFKNNLSEFPNALATAARVHLKIVLMDLAPEVPAVWESSANLRRNGCAEFLAVHRAADLHRFYAEFIDRTASDDGQ